MKKGSITEKIISLMFSAGRAINRQYFEEAKQKSGLSILQIEVLKYIKGKKEVLMKDLAGYLFIAPPSATSLVEDLVKMKLVRRSEDKDDRRIIMISLTRRGKGVLEKFMKRKMEKIGEKINKLTSREKKSLFDILVKLSKEEK